MEKTSQVRDEFLSEEDLDLRNMSQDEIYAYWNMWLEQAQATNDRDKNHYSHGVFMMWPDDIQVNTSRTIGKNSSIGISTSR